MSSSNRAVYFANQTVRRGTRFLLAVSFILRSYVELHQRRGRKPVIPR